MDRQELTALRDAIDTVLTWPESVRAEIGRWLAPEAAPKSGNGLDHHPPPTESTGKGSKLEQFPTPRPAKARAKARRDSLFNVHTRLLAALRERPDQSAPSLTLAGTGTNRARSKALVIRRAQNCQRNIALRPAIDRRGSSGCARSCRRAWAIRLSCLREKPRRATYPRRGRKGAVQRFACDGSG
jgi:hypothetical protein